MDLEDLIREAFISEFNKKIDINDSAKELFKIKTALVEAGFTDREAIKIMCALLH